MRGILLLISTFFLSKCFSQYAVEIRKTYPGLILKEKTVYLFCRGTKRKAGLIAKKFNRVDGNITHVGIGLLIAHGLHIYNVTDKYSRNSALSIDSLGSFLGTDVFYFSVWECNNNADEFELTRAHCAFFAKKRIYFDATFRIAEDDTLYCSEFCASVLNKVNPLKYGFKPCRITLNNSLYESLLGRKIFTYYPVDFFVGNSNFKKIYESHLGP